LKQNFLGTAKSRVNKNWGALPTNALYGYGSGMLHSKPSNGSDKPVL